MKYHIVNKMDLPKDGETYEMEGYLHGNSQITLILVDIEPGAGPRLHSHPYEEVFVILEGCATYTIGSDTIEARAGQIAIVPANIPHKFVNSGEGRLRQVDIHQSPRFITHWLEED